MSSWGILFLHHKIPFKSLSYVYIFYRFLQHSTLAGSHIRVQKVFTGNGSFTYCLLYPAHTSSPFNPPILVSHLSLYNTTSYLPFLGRPHPPHDFNYTVCNKMCHGDFDLLFFEERWYWIIFLLLAISLLGIFHRESFKVCSLFSLIYLLFYYWHVEVILMIYFG